MKNVVFAAIWTEILKIRRSKIFLITLILSVFVPLIMGFMVFIAKNPEIARKLGILGAKASVLNLKADWPTYLGLLNLAIVGLGLALFGFVTSWVFGREHSDHTMKDLLALPISRSKIVSAKFAVILVWCALLTFVFFISGMFAGAMVQIPGWTDNLFFSELVIFLRAALLVILLCTPVAFFAGIGRGYLSPIGFVIITLMLSQFVGVLGFAQYFPWSIPLLYVSEAGDANAQPGIISYIIIILTSVLGFAGTLSWWKYADQK